MIKVGLTGGLGSGKTTAAKVFEILGIPVFYADDEAKKLTHSSKQVKSALIAEFGDDLYDENGLKREVLAHIIFTNKDAIKKVNAIIHPAVRNAFEVWAKNQKAPYVLQEAAILFETEGYKHFDKNILVSAPKQIRIERAMKRSSWSKKETENRMKNQWDESHKIPLADFVILNDGTQQLLPQILRIHENLLGFANKSS